MDDSVYIFFFTCAGLDVAKSILEKSELICPELILKHRPIEGLEQQYSIQYKKDGTRFWDDDLDKIYSIVRESNGQLTGSSIFYQDEDFE